MGFFNFFNRIPSFSNFSFFKTPVVRKATSYLPLALAAPTAFTFPFLGFNNSIFGFPSLPMFSFGDTFIKNNKNNNTNINSNSNARLSEKDSKKYDGLIKKYSQQFGVNPNLVKAVMKQESSFRANVKSHCNAYGLMQLMPETAASLGVDRYSVEGNIKGGVKYLGQLLSRFNGNVKLAVAAYNAGPNRKCYAKGQIPNIPETQNYVRKVLKYYNEYSRA